MGKEIPPFSFSAGERKIMAHFVVNPRPHYSLKNQQTKVSGKIAETTKNFSTGLLIRCVLCALCGYRSNKSFRSCGTSSRENSKASGTSTKKREDWRKRLGRMIALYSESLHPYFFTLPPGFAVVNVEKEADDNGDNAAQNKNKQKRLHLTLIYEEPRRKQRGIGSEQARFERDCRVGGGAERRYPPFGDDGYR